MQDLRSRRDAVVRVRLRQRELELVRSAARCEEVSLAEFFRTATLPEAKRIIAGAPGVRLNVAGKGER